LRAWSQANATRTPMATITISASDVTAFRIARITPFEPSFHSASTTRLRAVFVSLFEPLFLGLRIAFSSPPAAFSPFESPFLQRNKCTGRNKL